MQINQNLEKCLQPHECNYNLKNDDLKMLLKLLELGNFCLVRLQKLIIHTIQTK